jgi:hypothetical protein
MRRRLAAVVVVLVTAVVAPAGVASAADGRLTLVGGGPVKQVLKDGKTAAVTLVVRADAAVGGRVAVRLVDANGHGVWAGATSGPDDLPLLALSRWAPQRIAPGEVRRVPLTFTFAKARTEAFAGTLILRISGSPAGQVVTPVALTVEKPGSRWAKATIVPAKVTLNTSSCRPWPLHHGCGTPDDVTVQVTGLVAGPPAFAKGATITAPPSTVPAQASTGGRADVTLRAAKEIPETATVATLVVSADHITRRGSYEATLPTDPTAEKAPSVTATVVARDWFLWPLLVLLAGAGAAFLVRIVRDRRRPKNVLEAVVDAAGGRYLAARKTLPAGSACPYEPPFPQTRDGWKTDDQLAAGQLRAAIKDADTNEALEALGDQVADLAALVDGWSATCAKATALRTAADQIRGRTCANAIVSAADALVAPMAVPPADAAAVTELQNTLDHQCEAIETWTKVDDWITEAQKVFDDLEPRLSGDDLALLQQNRPDALRTSDLARIDDLSSLESYGVLAAVRDRVRVLTALSEAHPRPVAAPSRRRGATGTDSAAAAVPLPVPSLIAAIFHHDRPVPTAEQLRVRTERADLVDFLFSATIATLAFFATIYPGDEFGSVWDYVAAFAAGAGGELVINWNLLPWYRSYKPPKVGKATGG